jgi:hypothetical protein
MACFLVAAAVGVFTVAFRRSVPENLHIGWLNLMIWGSVLALLVEHIWHGEVVPWFPFLTAMENPADAAAMFHEMATIGIPMLIVVVAIWAVAVYVSNKWFASAPVASAQISG